MKDEQKDRLRRHQIPGMPPDPAISGVPLDPPKIHPIPPLQIPIVHVAASSEDEGDRLITEQLLHSCLQGDIYQCPRCDFSTPSAGEMVNHIADEINRSMYALSQLYQQPVQPQPPLDRKTPGET